MIVPPGTTGQSIDVQVVDDSGNPVTGLTAATFPPVYYSLAGPQAATQITPLSDLALITTAFTANGIKERTGSAGVYRLDVPDAAFASAGQLTIYGEASGKHLICPRITVAYLKADVEKTGGLTVPWITTGSANLFPAVVADNGIGANSFIDGAITAAKFNVDAIEAIQSGLATAGGAMTLTPGERDDLATAVESHLLDEGDSQMLINAIVGAIGNTNVDEAVLVAAIRADLERVGGVLKLIDAKTTNLPASPAATGDIPTASAVAAAVMASTAANGVAASTILSRLNGLARGNVVPTDNGDGTVTLAFKAEDNTTTLFSITYNPTTGARS